MVGFEITKSQFSFLELDIKDCYSGKYSFKFSWNNFFHPQKPAFYYAKIWFSVSLLSIKPIYKYHILVSNSLNIFLQLMISNVCAFHMNVNLLPPRQVNYGEQQVALSSGMSLPLLIWKGGGLLKRVLHFFGMELSLGNISSYLHIPHHISLFQDIVKYVWGCSRMPWERPNSRQA